MPVKGHEFYKGDRCTVVELRNHRLADGTLTYFQGDGNSAPGFDISVIDGYRMQLIGISEQFNINRCRTILIGNEGGRTSNP